MRRNGTISLRTKEIDMSEQAIEQIIVSVILVAIVVVPMIRWRKRQAAETERWLREEGC